jgi:hypothetical protein
VYGPLIKYGLMLLAFVGFCVALIAYGEHRKQLEWNAAIAAQAVKSAETVIKAAENTAAVETKYIHVKGETQIVTQIVEKEIIKYVDATHPPCVLSLEFERVWDRASDRVPAAGPAPRGADATTDSGLTPVEVLRAHADDAAAYYTLRDAYTALVEWVKTTYAIQLEGAGR